MTTPTRSVDFASLVAALAGARVVGTPAGRVGGIAHDSRVVERGSIFVALRGTQVDGHAFLARAAARGAMALVVDEVYARAHPRVHDIATIVVPDTRRALSRLAAAFYEYPSRSLRVAGVTGTNGKTTTTQLLAAMLAQAQIPSGTIGTLGARFSGETWALDTTTPLALELQALLAQMRDRGAAAVAMEVSSHALALDRVADVEFATAALTNVTRDHLDFHGDVQTYAAAKRSLFDRAPLAIFNADDAFGARWASEFRSSERVMRTYGLDSDADLRARDVAVRADGSSFTLDGVVFTTRLPGRFNIANVLAAIALARDLGGDDASSARALATFECVPGRMEHFGRDGIDVLVDYAHTPDALEVVLRAARETTQGSLALVFGCGGDRDRGKRPQMGRIAANLADRIFVTNDNPRSENPQAIVDEIFVGIPNTVDATALLDRRVAIARAIATAAPGDVVIVAGKGHETYQIVGATRFHFDDREEVRAALAARPAVTA